MRMYSIPDLYFNRKIINNNISRTELYAEGRLMILFKSILSKS